MSMRLFSWGSLFVALLFPVVLIGQSEGSESKDYLSVRTKSRKPQSQSAPATSQKIFSCSMHPEFVAKRSGTCPYCGMRLLAKSISTNAREERNPSPPSRFAFGIFLTQNFGFQRDTSEAPMGSMGSGNSGGNRMPQMTRAAVGAMQGATVTGDGSGMPPGSMMSTAFTLSARGGYQVSRITSLTLSALGDFQQGVGDPTAGLNFNFPLTTGLMGMASFEAAAPLSQTSRDNSKITTLIFSVGPMYHKYDYSLSLMGFGAYSLYRSDDVPTNPQSDGMGNMPMDRMASPMTNMGGMSGMNTRELMRHGGMVSFGYPLVKNLKGTTSASLLAIYREDESIGWMSDASLLRLSYLWDGFAGSIGFSLMSDMKNDQTITAPTQPFIGFRLQYVFGNQMTLGGTEACSMSQMMR